MRLRELMRKPFGKKPPLGEQATVAGLSPELRPGILGALSSLSEPGDVIPGGYPALRKMQNDPQVKACLSTKKFAVLSQGWEVHAASPALADVAVADFVRGCFSDLRGSLLDDLYDVLDALALGVSLTEINYKLIESGPNAGKVGLLSLKAKDPSGFQFETDAFLNLTGLRGSTGAVYDVEKFVVYAYMPAYENPMGTSDLRAAYRPWFVKGQLLNWWAKYLELNTSRMVMGSL